MAGTTGGLPHGIAVTLPSGDSAARAARTLVDQLLRDEGCSGQLVDDSRLVAHELVSNGVIHGDPDARAEISFSCQVLEAHIVIAVVDPGRHGTVAVRHASAESIHGRGLAIVEALSERWTVDRSDGTRVEAWLAR